MGKKAPFWIFVEDLKEQYKSTPSPPSFSEIKQLADSKWPNLTAEEREYYRSLSKQERMSPTVIQYDTTFHVSSTKSTPQAKEVKGLSEVLEKRFILVDASSKASISDCGEIALAGFTLKSGVSKFLSAHILPSNRASTENSRQLLRFCTNQQTTIVASSRSEVLTEVSQFCNCQQCSAGKIVMFARPSKLESIRDAFRDMLAEQEASFISIIIEPIEKLAAAIHVALNGYPAGSDTGESLRTVESILHNCSVQRKMPCSRHGISDVECAHREVIALVFSLLDAFNESLEQLGVTTIEGKHFLRSKSNDDTQSALQCEQTEVKSFGPVVVVPGPVVFLAGRGRLRTTAQIVPLNEFATVVNGHAALKTAKAGIQV